MREIRKTVERYAAGFDAAVYSPSDAEAIVSDAAATEHMLATVKALAAKRAAEGGQWRRNGAASPAHDLARKTGTSVNKARESLDLAENLGSLPNLDAAARKGEVSPSQAAPIADAAKADPAAEERLVRKAKRSSLRDLMDECARTKAAAEPDDEARHRAIHAGRFLRRRRCADGAGEIHYRSTVDEVAEIFSIVRGHANTAFDRARLEGRREPEEAYLADGLLAAVRAGAGEATQTATDAAEGRVRRPSPTKIVVRIDWDALLRGWPVDGEVCEIVGLGPVAVSAVRAMMASGDAFLAAVVTKGLDVAAVVHLGRKPTAYQDTALDWLSPTCTNTACNRTERLQTDHREDWARTKVTLLRWLDRYCDHCHDLKTTKGWAPVEGTGKRPLVPPDDPRHPRFRCDRGEARAGPVPPGAA